MAKSTALYYPTIDIEDDGWLKNALLFWDRIRTIVPESLQGPYRTEITLACAEEGVLEPLVVSSDMEAVEDLSEATLDFLTSPEALSAASGGHGIYLHPDKLPSEIRRILMHPDKLPSEIRSMLEMGGKVRRGWTSASPEFAGFYMTLLAEKLSRENGLALLTNSPFSDRLAKSVRADGATISMLDHTELDPIQRRHSHRRHTRPKSLEQALLSTLAVEFLSVDPDTPLKEILRFREKRHDELCKLRLELEKLSSSLDFDAPLAAVQQQASDVLANSIRPAVNDLKETLTDARLKWEIGGLIGVSTLSFASEGALALAGLTIAPYAVLAAAGVSLVTEAILFNRQRRQILRENPHAYLLHAQRQFQGPR